MRIGLHDDRKTYRTNLWTIVFYPGDSAPNDYLNILQNLHIPCLLSPMHDKDKNGNGFEKKKHQHLMIYYGLGQKKSYDQVLKIANLLGVNECDYVDNRNALVRYFIHADNPEKYQYSKDDLISLNGFEWLSAFNGLDDEDMLYSNIEEVIFNTNIINYAQLIKYLKNNNFKYELMFIRKHTIHFVALLNGMYQDSLKIK